YLAFTVMLAAGLAGIEGKYEIPEPTEENIYKMTPSDMASNHINAIPDSLENAINAMEDSKIAREALGDHIFEQLITNKKVEWARYREKVTDYEIEKYFPFL
ncbi:MAG: glutamine synthetase, partial [candidate division Zixibacteria bacterium]|nr:glutamine synthetase [candidate division Zixibacteria bacterium]